MTKKKWCGRKSNLSSFHSKFIFWLGIQNAKTFMGRSEEWTWRVKNDIQVIVIVALLLLLARPPSIHSSTWAKSSIANCFCLDQLCGRARQKRPHRWVGWLAAWLPACLPALARHSTDELCLPCHWKRRIVGGCPAALSFFGSGRTPPCEGRLTAWFVPSLAWWCRDDKWMQNGLKWHDEGPVSLPSPQPNTTTATVDLIYLCGILVNMPHPPQ